VSQPTTLTRRSEICIKHMTIRNIFWIYLHVFFLMFDLNLLWHIAGKGNHATKWNKVILGLLLTELLTFTWSAINTERYRAPMKFMHCMEMNGSDIGWIGFRHFPQHLKVNAEVVPAQRSRTLHPRWSLFRTICETLREFKRLCSLNKVCRYHEFFSLTMITARLHCLFMCY
jgi:hypothetical protein